VVEAKAPRASSAPAAPVVPEEAGVGAALGRVSYGLFVVASRRGDRYNGQTANTVFQVTSDPARVAIGINKKNLTHEFLAESGVAAVTKYELSPVVGCPVLSDGRAYLELRLDRSRASDAGTHSIFVGDVVGGRILGQGEVMTYADYRELRSRPPAGGQTGGSSRSWRE
jgi:flavin reductase (DIM6/NTAB) family NADH-FMN oxidoreductase RutF